MRSARRSRCSSADGRFAASPAVVARRAGGAALAASLGFALTLFVAAPARVAAAAPADAGPRPSAADAGDASPPPAVPACVHVTTRALYSGVGYNHWVDLQNGCEKRASCVVSTDVNPQPTTAEVDPGAKTEILTFMGSPAYAFTARVACTLR
jgi:hypothetical protein